jgi:hypothetical protein
MSASVVHLRRPFRNRLELLHGHGSTLEVYSARLEHVDGQGRYLVGEYDEAYAAFATSLLWRARVCYLTCREAVP